MAVFIICLYGLVVRALGWYSKGPWFKSYQVQQKIDFFWKKLFIFLLFSKIYFLPQKTTASQTNFDFTNKGSNMHCFSCRAI